MATKSAGSNEKTTSDSVGNRSSNDVENFDEKQTPYNNAASTVDAHMAFDSSDDDSLNKVDTAAQAGVQKVQAMTQVWSKREIILAYVLMWLIQFILAFASGIIGTLTPYVTSSFQEHSLTALTSVVANLISGLWKLPYAKLMDIWGRPQALTLGVSSITLGIIMMAGCNNVATYCAAQVFFWLGYNSIGFSITVFIADSSKLKNRGLMLGFISSPYLITTWVYGLAANDIIMPGGMGLRWGFGIFAIVVPLVCAPWVILMWIKQIKAIKMGLVPAHSSTRTFGQSFVYYAREFDVIGLGLLALGLALFLLSFNLYALQPNQWRDPMIICFIIFGALLIIAFCVWEKFAPVTFVPWELLKNRTVIFTYTMAFALYIGWYVWNSYFFSLLIVLFSQPIQYATYTSNTYTMGSCVCSILYGLALRKFGKLKVWSISLGAPLTILGTALMIYFRNPSQGIGYIVMCQVFIAFGGGILVISEQTTLMAVSRQQDFPALLAVESTVIYVGSAIGSTIAGAIWTGIFPTQLLQRLPADAQASYASIFGDLTVQSGYPVGTPARNAINDSYAYTQRFMLIAATAIYCTMLVSIALWQNVDVRKQKQRTVGLL
ncbi:hypothetical protein LTS08_004531 [Lithohypha guttulata]|nr:hypothetical protein LTS08_004531 [Lithohypha guttulata]